PDQVVGVAGGVALAVGPAAAGLAGRRDHPVLGGVVHGLGADVDLDRLIAGADHGGGQRLVAVELGRGDEVLEPAGHRVPAPVDGPKGDVAVAGPAGDHDQDAVGVVDLAAAPLQHRLVDRVVVARVGRHHGLDLGRAQVGGDLAGQHGHVLAAARVALVDHADDLVVLGRVQGGEGQVLQVAADHLEP